MDRCFVLGVDPGFASVGIALVRLDLKTETVLNLAVIHTEKSQKKRGVRASDDNFRRAKELTVEIDRWLWAASVDNQSDTPTVKVICAETMSFPRNSSAAAKMAICWGVLGSLATLRNIPVVQASPQEIKISVCGSKSATKEEVQVKLRDRYSSQSLLQKVSALSKVERDHPFDALAAVVACLDSEVVRLARSM